MGLTWCLSGSWPCVWNLRCVCGTLKIWWFCAGLHAELHAVKNPFWMSKISTLSMAATERNQRSPGRFLMHTSSLHKKVMKRVSFCDLCHKTLWAKQFAKGCEGDFDWTSHVAVVFLKKHNSNSYKLLCKLIPPLYPQDLGATKTETFPRKLCRGVCKDTNDRAADKRSAVASPAGSGAQEPHKLHPPWTAVCCVLF